MFTDVAHERIQLILDRVLYVALGFLLGGAFVGWYGIAAPCN
jgi:hypothetical protein